jgi:bacterioferritin-associated ferredoxin
MVVCVCRGVTDREIRRAVDDGAVCRRQLEARCIGDRCGMCVESLDELIADQLAASGETACSECRGSVAMSA